MSETPAAATAKPKPKPKPPKLEDKPFGEFINDVFIPEVAKQLSIHGLEANSLELLNGERPVVGGDCPMVCGEFKDGRRFWICFSGQDINSAKTISLADPGTDPSLLESFLIDEKRMTLPLLVSRLMQRLNGQKWLGSN